MTTPSPTKISVPWWQWWPLLVGPIGMVMAFWCDRTGPWAFYTKPVLETIAIGVTASAVGGGFVHVAVTRSRFHVLLAAVALMVMSREFHWEWTTKTVFVVLGLVGVLAFLWRRDVLPYVDGSRALRVWPLATALTYVLSQAIARRCFRGVIPDEEAVYSDMEEFIENVAHVMLLVITLVGPWRRRC